MQTTQVLRLGLALVLSASAWAVHAQVLDEAARRADLAQFRAGFFDLDKSYPPEARAQAQAELVALEQRPGDMDALALSLALARIAALADSGHSAALAGPRINRSNRVEIRMAPLAGDFVVLRAREPNTDLLGARLLAIDGVPLTRLRAAAHQLSGGLPAWRDGAAPLLFESPQQLHALGLLKAAESAVYHFELPSGAPVARRLVADPPRPDRPRAGTERLLLPEVLPDMLGWKGLLGIEQAPWALQDALRRQRFRIAPEINALVIDMRLMRDSGDDKLKPFFDAVRNAAAASQPEHLVLDLRQNGGGDLTQVRDFAESLPALVPGRLFVLTGPWTFSAAISALGYLKQAAPARVTIVGEPVGDRLEFFAEGRAVTLAHSGTVLLPATERHDYVNGCKQHSDCHAPVTHRPIAVSSLAPDIAAPWTLAAYRAGTDPAMQAVAEALKPRAPPR